MKELTSRQKQAIETKQRIRQTAIQLLQTESYDRLTMNQIAAAAGISVGTLYHHFKSKEELFFSGYQHFDDMVRTYEETLTFSSNVEAIRSIVYAQTVGAFHLGKNYISSILSIQLSPHGSLFYSDHRVFPRYIYRYAEQAVASGELIAPNGSDEIAQSVLRIARGCIFDCAVRNQPDTVGKLVSHDLDILLSSYHANPSHSFPPIDLGWYNAFNHWISEN